MRRIDCNELIGDELIGHPGEWRKAGNGQDAPEDTRNIEAV